MCTARQSRPTCLIVFVLALGSLGNGTNARADSGSEAKPLDEPIRSFLAKYCADCHGAEKPKRNLRVDRLSADFANKANRDNWQKVLDKLQAGAMPPKSQEPPSEKEVRSLCDWIKNRTEAADIARRDAFGRVVLRRLNRVEYEKTIRDLLGVPVNLKDLLPPDSASDGFDNVGAALHLSSFQMEKYLEAADTALSLAIANGPQPKKIEKRYSLKNQHGVKNSEERVFRIEDDTVVLFSSSPWNAVHLYEFYPPDRGKYRFRISNSACQSSGKPVTFRVDAGTMGMTGKTVLVGYFDAPADKASALEFTEFLEARSTVRILPYGLANAQTVHKIGADKYEGPGLAIQWIEVEGPLQDTWPPASHRKIFGDLAQSPLPNKRERLEVISKTPDDDAQRILRDFARHAFRRNVSDDDIKPFLKLVKAKLADDKNTFEQAVRVGLLAVMLSPDFLFLREKPGKLDDFALASRLSYFLWSTMPDEELLALAEKGTLGKPETLRAQVERMLKDPRASAFTENFVGQWLGLRDIDFTLPSHILYPEYDDMLRASMVRETELFFSEVLKNDLSLTNFVSSDFSLLNGRLAKHYGIAGVEGWDFKKVKLPPESHRGGVMTMASVLKVTANGTSTSPVTRGAWVLDRILGTPPPRPPADVPALEPDIRGATTIREQLAKHRQISSCASCHAKIDPPGFALESFDVIGGWRENYRTSGNGEPVTIDGRKMPYLKGRKVDPADVLPDGKQFENIDEFKRLLLNDKDQLARSLTEKLVTYATGGPPEKMDRPDIDAIVRKVRDKDYGFRALVHEVVQSDLFRKK
jgi:cytochrome c553